MRDFRDAKGRARALRDALKSKAIETTHAEALELVAKAFGYKNWQGVAHPRASLLISIDLGCTWDWHPIGAGRPH
jgi:hypothetical protein